MRLTSPEDTRSELLGSLHSQRKEAFLGLWRDGNQDLRLVDKCPGQRGTCGIVAIQILRTQLCKALTSTKLQHFQGPFPGLPRIDSTNAKQRYRNIFRHSEPRKQCHLGEKIPEGLVAKPRDRARIQFPGLLSHSTDLTPVGPFKQTQKIQEESLATAIFARDPTKASGLKFGCDPSDR